MREAVEQALVDARYEKPRSRRVALIWLKSCPSSGCCPEDYDAYMKQQAERYEAAGDDPTAVVNFIRSQPVPASPADSSNFPTLMAKRMGVPLLAMRLEATCAGGLRAIAEAARLLLLGEADVAIVAGGVIRRTHYVLSQYAQLMALSRWKGPAAQASMPFDRRRSGMVISESAGALVLETAEHAAARGMAEVHAQLAGWGLTVSAEHITKPSVDMIEYVVRGALAASGTLPETVDAINAHGTSTNLNDKSEASALHRVFGPRMREIDVSAVKSLTGHGSGASGTVAGAHSARAPYPRGQEVALPLAQRHDPNPRFIHHLPRRFQHSADGNSAPRRSASSA